MGGISIWQLLIIFVIVLLLFGTNKLRNIGSDLGSSIRDFKKAMNEDQKKGLQEEQDANFHVKTLTDEQQTLTTKEDAKSDKQV